MRQSKKTGFKLTLVWIVFLSGCQTITLPSLKTSLLGGDPLPPEKSATATQSDTEELVLQTKSVQPPQKFSITRNRQAASPCRT
jgi:hypothetical protein